MTDIFDLLGNKITMEVDLKESSKSRLLMKVEKSDLIRYSSDRVPDGIYMVFDIEKDYNIPAVFCEIWAFSGKFDHAFHRFLENDINVNKTVEVYLPRKYRGQITKIINYRDGRSDLTDKEIFHFDLDPKEIKEEPEGECQFPYEVSVEFGKDTKRTIIPQWTPLQKLPIDRVRVGTVVEVWEVNGIFTIMKVIKL